MTENEQLEMIGIINRTKANEIHYRRKVQNQRGIINGLQKKVSRLQAENGRLSTLAELGNMRANDYRVMRDRALKTEAEIERLRANLNVDLEGFASEYDKKIKAEAYKEFAEKIKQKLLDKGFYPAIFKSVLDEADKEMIGE